MTQTAAERPDHSHDAPMSCYLILRRLFCGRRSVNSLARNLVGLQTAEASAGTPNLVSGDLLRFNGFILAFLAKAIRGSGGIGAAIVGMLVFRNCAATTLRHGHLLLWVK